MKKFLTLSLIALSASASGAVFADQSYTFNCPQANPSTIHISTINKKYIYAELTSGMPTNLKGEQNANIGAHGWIGTFTADPKNINPSKMYTFLPWGPGMLGGVPSCNYTVIQGSHSLGFALVPGNPDAKKLYSYQLNGTTFTATN